MEGISMKRKSKVGSTDGYPARPSRRTVVFGAASAAMLPLASAVASAQSKMLAFAPAVFDVVADRALVWLAGIAGITVQVRWGESANALNQSSPSLTLESDNNFTGVVKLSGLPRGKTIFYQIVSSGTPISGVGRFQSMRVKGQNFSLAFSGDMEERYAPFRIFDTLARINPDCFLHLGDTVYVDKPSEQFVPTLEHFRRKHGNIRSDRALQGFMNSCSTFAIWDDHEIEDGANAKTPHLGIAQKVFSEFWPTSGIVPGLLFRSIALSPDVDLIILDTRGHRSAPDTPDSPQKTILGSSQKRWFFDALKNSRATFKLVATSVPFHGGTTDAWGSYATERKEVVDFLANEKIRNVIMLSADFHFAREWYSKKTNVLEFMAGPLAAYLQFQKSPSDRKLFTASPNFSYGDGENFGMVHYVAADNSLRVEFRDLSGKKLYEKVINAVS
jgi:alkaline phosphatase D